MAMKITDENVHVTPHKYLGFSITWQPLTGSKTPRTAWRRTQGEADEFKAELIETQGKPKKIAEVGDVPA